MIVCAGLNVIGDECARIAEEHGFTVDLDNLSEKLMLTVDELSEAHEELRDGRDPRKVYYSVHAGPGQPDFGMSEPEGFAVECVDAIIRLLHLLRKLDVDVDAVLTEKMAYNESRPHKHGRHF